MKRFEYFLLGRELKAKTDIANKHYEKLDNTLEFNKIIKNEPKFNNYDKSNLIYNRKYSFYKFYGFSKKFDGLTFKSKYSFLHEFLNYLNKFIKLKTMIEITKKKQKMCMILLRNYIMKYQ